MRGLDIIGAGEGLAAYSIVLHVRSIDTAKLRSAVAGDSTWGVAIPSAMMLVDQSPQVALEIAVPLAKSQLEKIGVVADISTTKAPVGPPLPPHQMLKVAGIGMGVGAVLGIVLALFGGSLYHLIRRK